MPFFIVSGLLVIASWVLVLTHGLNLGVDFVGGQMIRITFTQSREAPVAAARGRASGLWRADHPDLRRAQCGVDPDEAAGGQTQNRPRRCQMAKRITAAVSKAPSRCAARRGRLGFGQGFGRTVSGPRFLALGLAAIAISASSGSALNGSSGRGAAQSLVHDVSLTLGMFAITQMEFDLNIVAAVLTIIGYSLNDTVGL